MAKELRPLIDALQIVADIAKFAAGVVSGLTAAVISIGAKLFQVLVGVGAAGVKAWEDMKKGYNEHIAPLVDDFKENWKTITPVISDIFTLMEVAGKGIAAALIFASDEIIGPIQTVYNDLLVPIMNEIEEFIDYVEGSTIMSIYDDATKGKNAVMAGETNLIGAAVGIPIVSDKQVVMHFNNKIDVSGVTDKTSKDSLAKDIAKILQKNIRASNYSFGGKGLA